MNIEFLRKRVLPVARLLGGMNIWDHYVLSGLIAGTTECISMVTFYVKAWLLFFTLSYYECSGRAVAPAGGAGVVNLMDRSALELPIHLNACKRGDAFFLHDESGAHLLILFMHIMSRGNTKNYIYTHMPMGLQCSPAYLDNRISEILPHTFGEAEVFPFVEDIGIRAPHHKQVHTAWEALCKMLVSGGFSINRKKSKVGNAIVYAKLNVCNEGVSMTEAQLEDLQAAIHNALTRCTLTAAKKLDVSISDRYVCVFVDCTKKLEVCGTSFTRGVCVCVLHKRFTSARG
eukprot:GHVR01128366.1.p1 GENE.GHVR01128366.1~~GHVR01128366.1.p1  ORF type:complete len:288 (-),score=31.28 GHVR01128366.1:64-927(-)